MVLSSTTLTMSIEQSDMDVPKITIFKSPPWQKPVVNLPTPKITDVYEEFPVRSKLLGRRVAQSQSLECIPENTILQDIHKHTTAYSREYNRLSPHQVLPPISTQLEGLPEMRQRAYSDPNRYTAIIKKRAEEKKESPLAKFNNFHPTPPKEGSPQNSKTCSKRKEMVPVKNRKTLPSTEHHMIPGMSDAKTSHNGSAAKDARPPIPLTKSRPKLSSDMNNSSSPVSTPESRTNRNRKLINQSLNQSGGGGGGSDENPAVHPAVNALKASVSRGRRNSLPGALHEKPINLRKTSKSPPVRQTQPGVKKTVAYALIGSPGRDRWPSPDRNSSSYINPTNNTDYSTPSSSTSTESSSEHIDEVTGTTYTPTTSQLDNNPPMDSHASNEYKSILKDLQAETKMSNCRSLNSPGVVSSCNKMYHFP